MSALGRLGFVALAPLAPLLAALACSDGGSSTDASASASATTGPDETTSSASSTEGSGGESEGTSAGTTEGSTAGTSTAGTSTAGTSTDGTSTDATTGDTDGVIYPEPEWMPGAPEEHGLSTPGLEHMADVADGSDSNCLAVTQGGVLVGEWYWNGFDADKDQDNVYSVSKSVTSALVGVAIDRGELQLEAPAGFPEWAGTESEGVKVRNLISNDSGRQWTFDLDYIQLGLAQDQTQFAIDLGQDKPPGTWWEYNNAAIQTLERVLEVGTGVDVGLYAQEHLFTKIHMSATMGRDASSNPLTYQGVSASCRDLARFGYLYLRKGRWAGGVQVVPESWVAASITPSTALNSAYGYMWWLNFEGHWILPSAPLRDEGDGRIAPQAPEEVFAAIGAFGQLIVVDPTTDVVWVRLGPTDLTDATGTKKLGELWDAFAAAQLP